jgi:TetR/AcrR family transcriptional regulator
VTEAIRHRDADRSRAAILEAADELFAREGFYGVSLQEIGERAGVSRGTPGYFFGSKAALYRAVLAAAVGRLHAALAPVHAEASAEPERVLAGLIRAFLRFVAEDKTFVGLVQHETMRGGELMAAALRGPVLDDALAALSAARGGGDAREALVAVVALCWFPYVHEHGLLAALGVDPHDPEFIRRHERRVLELALLG